MIANLHTHTPRCRHAVGAEEEYVRCALQSGLQTLGFSDHAPYPFPDGYYSTFRMFPEELTGYVETVDSLRKQYAGQIQIPLGVEAEYYPKFFRDMVSMMKDHGIEYMLLGQHMLYDEMEGISTAPATADASLLRQYCNQTIDAIYTGLFTYFAHPDIMNFVGDPEIYRQEMGRLCRAAKPAICHWKSICWVCTWAGSTPQRLFGGSPQRKAVRWCWAWMPISRRPYWMPLQSRRLEHWPAAADWNCWRIYHWCDCKQTCGKAKLPLDI